MMTDELKAKLKLCRLSGVSEHYEHIINEAKEKDWTYDFFLEALLDQEIIVRENSRFQRLIKQAKFPTLKTIEQFDFSKAPYLSKKEITDLLDNQYIEDKTNLLFLGAPGTGKSHIATSLGIEACRSGKSVAFYTAANLGNILIEMQDEYQLGKFLDKLKKVDIIIIDELGYVELSRQTTHLMFQIFSERYERGSIIITTNLEFAEWTSIFHDGRMTAAILDRLIHNSKIILFNGESYRYRVQKND
ncbi:MAG TPA: IS21-like element helper ATPase IstB [Thermoclostridium sp.]|nr:IS21-like element helper ATPase IstB [Thermoclostridium sp.]